ncbi:hypothetical protein BDQ17DRAFT_1478959, partial [Cyathus striatus]
AQVPLRSPGSDLIPIQSIINRNDITSSTCFKMAEVISKWYYAFLSVKETTTTKNKFEWYLGCPVVMFNDSCMEFDIFSHLSGHFEAINSQRKNPKTTWTLKHNNLLFHIHETFTENLTCLRIRKESIIEMAFKNVDHHKITVYGYCEISEDAYHHWLSQVPYVLKNHPLFIDITPLNFGIVSQVNITLEINIFLSSLICLMEGILKAEVYLFILDPNIDKDSGKVSPPQVYWSLDQLGTKSLSDGFAASKGLTISKIELSPQLLGLPKFIPGKAKNIIKSSSSYIEDKDNINYLKTYDEFKRAQEKSRFHLERDHNTIWWTNETGLMDRYISEVQSPDITSLAWIGITTLEDCFRLLGTVYETKYVQGIRRKKYEQYPHEHELRSRQEDEWEEITYTDLQDNLDN